MSRTCHTTRPIDEILEHFSDAKPNGTGWKCKCPGHDDRVASLSIREGDDGKVLVKCHAGCETPDVLAKVGLRLSDLFAKNAPSNSSQAQPRIVNTYDYVDEQGVMLFQVVRYEPKGFKQRKPGGRNGWTWNLDGVRRVPFQLPELLATNPDDWVFVCEGEEDAIALTALGFTATTNAMGAGAWRPDYNEHFHGRRVVILPDRDKAGSDHAEQVAASLQGTAADIRVVALPGVPDKGDVRDWLRAGGTPDGLLTLVEQNPTWTGVADSTGEEGSAIQGDAHDDLGTVLADVEPQPIEWLSIGRLARGKTTILDGDPGLGKSTVALDWAARITRGEPLPDGPKMPPRGVVMLSAEDDPADTIRPRADVAGADVSKILILTERADGSLLSIPNDLNLIEAAIRRVDAALLIIDPLMAFISGDVNANRDQDIRRAMAPVRTMAERTGVAVLVIRHLTKGGGENAVYRGGGSIGIIGAARFGLIVGADPEDTDRALIASSKCNLARKPDTLAYRLQSVTGTDVARVAWDGTSTVTASGLLAAAESHDDGDDRDEVRSWLRDYLSLGPKPADETLREGRRAGFGEKSIRRAKTAIGVRSTKSGFGQTGKWSWSLPDHELPETPKTDDDAMPVTLTALDTLGHISHLNETLSIDGRHNDDDMETKMAAKMPNTPNTPKAPGIRDVATLGDSPGVTCAPLAGFEPSLPDQFAEYAPLGAD